MAPRLSFLSSKIKRSEWWFEYQGSLISLTDWQPATRRVTDLPAFVFIHGRFGESEMWFPLIRGLALRYRCVTLDLPGHGRSTHPKQEIHSLEHCSELLERTLHQIQSPMPILVGHDVGGAIALLRSFSHDRQVPMILINSSSPCLGLSGPPIGRWGGLTFGARLWLGRLLRNSPRLESSHAKRLKAPWLRRESREALIKAWESYEGSWPSTIMRRYWQVKAGNYRCPVMLLWGSNDPLHPMDEALSLIRHLPDAILHQKECGHWPCLEDPGWVESKIKEFLFRLQPEQAYFSAGF